MLIIGMQISNQVIVRIDPYTIVLPLFQHMNET